MIGIIGLLTAVIFVSVMQARASARDKVRAADIEQIDASIQIYSVANNEYPDSLEDLVTAGVFSTLPTDPINEDEYVYSYSNETSCYTLNYKKELGEQTVETGNCD